MSNHERVALLTGAAGFVGSHLAEALLARGWRVRGLDALTEFNGRERKERNLEVLGANDRFDCARVDMRTTELESLVEGCDTVFHLAALPGVRTSWGDAFKEYSSTNIEATARLLEVCKKMQTPRFVYSSSSSVYGAAERFPVRESDPTRPISPYGVSKLAGEHLVRLYGHEFGLFTVSVRFFTVYGPRQRPDMAFHRFIRGILEGHECKIFGDGNQTRDFTYVSDAVASCLAAAERGTPGGFYNIGGGSRVTLREVIRILESHAGRKGQWAFVERESGDPKHTAASTELAREELGYRPEVDLNEGLRLQVEWMAEELNSNGVTQHEEMDLSLVIPLFNEEQSLEPLMARIEESIAPTGISYEVIFVDDGSTDGSLSVLERLVEQAENVRAVSMRRNYGKSAALAVGFERARGSVVATCDADLQDDPGEIPDMLRMLDRGAESCDLVSGWKKTRRDPVSKRWPSKLFNLVVSKASGVKLHDMNCGLKVYRREVVADLPVYGEFHRFLPVLAAWQGYKVREKVVKHDPRRFGVSKFGSSRFINGFLDLVSVMFLTGGQQSPIHLFGRIAIALLIVGGAICLWMFGIWVHDGALRVRPLFVFGLVCLVVGIQFISIGLLGEMLAFHNRRREYGIKREIGDVQIRQGRDG